MRHVWFSLALALLFSPGQARADQQRRTRLLVDADGMLRVDPIYFDLAKSTGGEMYFWADGEFVARAADVRAREPRGEGRKVAAHYGDVPVEATVEVEVHVPADPELGTIRFFAAVQKKESVTVTRPDGRIVDGSEDDVARVDTRFMAFVMVSDPQPGTWKVAIAGQGLFQATARTFAKPTSYDDLFFRFMHAAMGRHPGLFPVKGVPPAGSQAICSARIEAELEIVTFTFEDENGAVLDTVALVEEVRDPATVRWLTEHGGGAQPHEFFGECFVPATPFRFVARGVNRAGKRYEQATAIMRDTAN